MPLVETSKSRLWPNVWKGIGLLLLALVFVSAVIGKRWQAQGNHLRLLRRSSWGFATGTNCYGERFYDYGIVERTTRGTSNSCGY